MYLFRIYFQQFETSVAVTYDNSGLSFPSRVPVASHPRGGTRSQGQLPRIEARLCHSPAVGTWMSYCLSLCLYFHTCEITFEYQAPTLREEGVFGDVLPGLS